ncbi:MAG: hypothetical protein ABIR39_04310 [Nocardioides sp.]|uniref:hypothetical protein n=1 Tax=Nocardioides sp. TaxID=35761 RepID=UPI003263CE0E
MDDTMFLGRIEVRPPLNEAERDHLVELAGSSSTLRGTPTGRGDSSVPFAHLAWEPCESGCCLIWNGTERAEHLTASLRFVVDHLLRPGAKVAGHRRFPGFTCDHVLDGVVAGTGRGGRVYVAEVTANRVGGASSLPACAQVATGPRGKPRPRPANVIEFRPRRA